MKVGETLEVTIGGMKVADAQIVDVNHKDSTVELVIPGRRVVMGFKTQLDVPPPVEQSTTHAILGVEQRTSDDAPTVSFDDGVEHTETPVASETPEPAPVAEEKETNESSGPTE